MTRHSFQASSTQNHQSLLSINQEEVFMTRVLCCDHQHTFI